MAIQKFILGKVSAYELNTALTNQNMAMNKYYIAIKNVYINYYVFKAFSLVRFQENVELRESTYFEVILTFPFFLSFSEELE